MPQGRSREEVAERLGIERDELVGGLNLTEAANLLGIAPSTLRMRAQAGKISHQRDGNRWLFFWWHMAEYLESREYPVVESQPAISSGAIDVQRRGMLPDDVEQRALEMGLL